jgi:hypothetical protein
VQNEKNNRLDTWRVIGWEYLRCDNTCTRFNGELMKNEEQIGLFGNEKEWEKEWVGMPEFNQKNTEAAHRISISFESYEDMQIFAEKIGVKITSKTIGFFYPPKPDKQKMVYADEK